MMGQCDDRDQGAVAEEAMGADVQSSEWTKQSHNEGFAGFLGKYSHTHTKMISPLLH